MDIDTENIQFTYIWIIIIDDEEMGFFCYVINNL